MKITIHDPKKNKTVLAGTLKDRVFTKTAKSNHYMVKESGYGISQKALEQLLVQGCDTIILKTKTKKYRIKFSDWVTKGKVNDYGHGKQVFLDKKYYTL